MNDVVMDSKDDQTVSSETSGISEAERMARIRELLIGPVVADEAARTAQSISTLDEAAKSQSETIASLQERIETLEKQRRVDIDQLRIRLLSLVEALLADTKSDI